jgi:sulfatase maturation enzyme AslB (radical SAM superfamily)
MTDPACSGEARERTSINEDTEILSAETASPVLTVPSAPRAFHVMSKPTGAVCNLDCEYCFFLSKEMLYSGSRFRMAADLQETYIRQLLEAHARRGRWWSRGRAASRR